MPACICPRGLWSVPGFSLKQGMLNGVGVANDYEPLALARYAEYFGAVSPWRSPDGLFNGRYRLIGDTPWRLLDLTGTRFYVVRRGEEAAVRMGQQPPGPDGGGFRRIADGEIQAFERAAALPRAWWVPRERAVPSAVAALSALRSPGFDPRREVILEREPGAEGPADPEARRRGGRAGRAGGASAGRDRGLRPGAGRRLGARAPSRLAGAQRPALPGLGRHRER